MKTIITSLLFALPIYLYHFDFSFKIVNSIIAIIAIYLLLKSNRRNLFFIGFASGILWFWWIGVSIYYYGFWYLIIPAILFIAITYGLLFWLIGFLGAFQGIGIFLISFIEPLGFNWFIPNLIFTDTYFGIDNLSFGFILIALTLFINIKGGRFFEDKIRYLFLLILIFAIDTKEYEQTLPKQKIFLASTFFTTEDKYNIKQEIFFENFKIIDEAIKDGFDVVVLPEDAFSTPINENEFLFDKLIQKSQDIAIITGAFYDLNGSLYNSSYFFHRGKVEVAHKVVLAPFGERIPLPKFFVDIINDLFYGGAKDFLASDKPTDFEIDGTLFRNAICYEATSKELFSKNPKYMIAISNNALFYPSIEPKMQEMLLRYYSKLHNTIIFHSTNYYGTGVIKN